MLGGDKDANDLDKLPQISTSGGDLVFTFQRDQATTDVLVEIEVGTDLETWPLTFTVLANTEAQEAGVTVIDNLGNPGFDTVSLTVVQAPDAKKFARLTVTP